MPLLVLDEPTAGLDPLMEEVFQSELTALKDDGRTVLLSSHILSEVERACDRVSIVRAGRIVDSGSLAELRHLTRTRVHAVLDAAPTLEEVSSWRGLSTTWRVDGTDLRCSVDAEHLGALVATLGNRGVSSLTCQPPTLEELFLARYQTRAGRRSGRSPGPSGTAGMTAATAPTGQLAPTISLGTRLAGFSHLLALAWRRDRILIPSSVLGLVVLAVGSAQATLALYPTDEAASTGLAGVLSNPSVLALYGPVAAHTADALAVFKTLMMGAFLTAVLGFVVVRRHTRTEEDEGRLELLGAGVVGRWSALAAAVTLATIAVVAASVLTGAGLAALGMDATGSIAFAIAWMTAGLAMIGVSAVIVQLASTTRGAAGLGFGFLGAVFALRAVADSADPGTFVHALGWLSPLGWAGHVEAYGANHTWILLLGVLALVVRCGRRPRRARPPRPRGRRHPGPQRPAPGRPPARRTAVARHQAGSRHDHRLGGRHGPRRCRRGVPARLGRRHGLRPRHPGPAREAGRHHRLDRGRLRRHRDPLRRRRRRRCGHRAGAAPRGFRAVGPRRGRARRPRPAEPAGSARTSLLPILLTAALLALLGAVVGLVGPSASPNAPSFGAAVGATLAAVPAVWVMIGVAAALAGAAPRFAPFSWGVLLVTFMITEIGPLTKLPSWVMDLSPFTHLSSLPGGSFEVVSAAVLTLIALALMVGGYAAYNRRDVA